MRRPDQFDNHHSGVGMFTLPNFGILSAPAITDLDPGNTEESKQQSEYKYSMQYIYTKNKFKHIVERQIEDSSSIWYDHLE